MSFPKENYLTGHMNFLTRLLCFGLGAFISCLPYFANITGEKSINSMIVEIMIPSVITSICLILGPYDFFVNKLQTKDSNIRENLKDELVP